MSRRLSLIALLLALGAAACAGNEPPVLQPVAPQVAFVGTRLDITLLAFDPDGDKLTFAFRSHETPLGSRAQIVPLADRGIFSWTPSASHVGTHRIDFTVSDGTTSDTQSVTIVVKPGTSPNTAPVFRRPIGFGTTLDLAKAECVDVDILVEDPDSIKVTISQDPVLSGSTLTRIGQLSALFHWCPSEEQKKILQHVLRLVANDGENPPVTKDFMIVLRAPLPTTCPGAAPQVLHSAPAATTSLEAITVKATVTDDKGLKGAPVVYHTTNEPHPGAVDISGMEQLKMTEVSPGYYEASLPNPVKGLPADSKRTIYYVIVAEDDDDAQGNCDHRTQAPEQGAYSVEVTAPQASQGCTKSSECASDQVCDGTACIYDTCTPHDTNGDKLFWEQAGCPSKHFCPVSGPTVSFSHCAAECSTDSECGTGRVCKVFDTRRGCGVAGNKQVGESCSSFVACAGKQMCVPWNGGYCSLSDCDSGGKFSGPCPSGSVCYPMPDSRFASLKKHWLCVKTCQSSANCRQSDGYECRSITDDTGASKKVCLLKAQP